MTKAHENSSRVSVQVPRVRVKSDPGARRSVTLLL